MLRCLRLKSSRSSRVQEVQEFKKFAHQARRPFPSVRQQEVQGRISERGSGLFLLAGCNIFGSGDTIRVEGEK